MFVVLTGIEQCVKCLSLSVFLEVKQSMSLPQRCDAQRPRWLPVLRHISFVGSFFSCFRQCYVGNEEIPRVLSILVLIITGCPHSSECCMQYTRCTGHGAVNTTLHFCLRTFLQTIFFMLNLTWIMKIRKLSRKAAARCCDIAFVTSPLIHEFE